MTTTAVPFPTARNHGADARRSLRMGWGAGHAIVLLDVHYRQLADAIHGCRCQTERTCLTTTVAGSRGNVTDGTIRELGALHSRNMQAGKVDKGHLLDCFCQTTGCNRQSAIRLLRHAPALDTRLRQNAN